MNGKDRIGAALELRQPDCVPIWEMAYNESSIIGIAKYFVDWRVEPNPVELSDVD